MNEIGEEKIDIIEWDEEPRKFVANALSPAKIEGVNLSEDTATVTVDEDQLSLAIGREGQNVRLAWKLTGYKIDIVGNGVKKEEAVVAPMADEVAPEVLPKKKSTKKTAKKDETETVVTEEVVVEEVKPEEVVEETPVVEEAAKEE
jgi:N utilization substance protein A